MNRVLENMNRRIEELMQIIQEKEIELSKAPEGVLNIAKAGNRVQYYYKKEPSDTKRRYLKNSEKQVVKALCQKDYDQKLLLSAKKELDQLKKFRDEYSLNQNEDIYANLNPERKKFVHPIVLPDTEFIQAWEQAEYQKKGFKDDSPEYYTDNGERVRSKTEILIANALKKYNVPYRYECPLYLNGYGTIYPDFTVLNVRLRKEMYWEHMGMMDDSDYLEKALQKITTYEKNDIFPGKQLILTHETARFPINSRTIEKMIFQYLK